MHCVYNSMRRAYIHSSSSGVVMYYKSRALAVNIPIWATSRGGRRVAQYYYYADRLLYIIHYIILYGVSTLQAFLTSMIWSASKAKSYCVRIGFIFARNACILPLSRRRGAVWCSRTNQIIHLLLKTRAWPSRLIIAGSHYCDMTRPIDGYII